MTMPDIFPFVIEGELTPHIAEKIIRLLDKKTLLQCRAVSRYWRDFIDIDTNLWNEVTPQKFRKAALKGRLDVCQLFVYHAENKNPPGSTGNTPLHYAARGQHVEICRLIIDNVVNKNPPEQDGITPFHWAAQFGNLDLCRLIIDNVTDKNPFDKSGTTPLYSAACRGHVEVCRLIIDQVKDKNPTSIPGLTRLGGPILPLYTPLHAAASQGHYEVVKLFVDNIEDKHPRDGNQKTPLDLAREREYTNIIELLEKY